MADDLVKLLPRVDVVTEAAPRPEIDPSQAEIVQSYLEKYFNIALSASCAPGGSIEFYTTAGKLFAKIDPKGAVTVETGDSTYYFTTEEILAAQKPQESSANTCEPEESECERSEPKGKKVIVNGDWAGVEDYNDRISLPADMAVDIYTEEEIAELEMESGEDLHRAAQRYAESAPSRARASEASSALETRSESRDRPREADTNSPHDEVSVSTNNLGHDIGAAPAPEVVSQGGAGRVEQMAPSGVNPAPYATIGAENTCANLGAGQIASALHFAPPQNQSERPFEKKGIAPDRRDSNSVRPPDRSGQFVASAERFVVAQNSNSVPEYTPIQNLRARPDGARVWPADVTNGGPVFARAPAGAPVRSRAGGRTTPATVTRAYANPRSDGEKIGCKAQVYAVPIGGDPAADARAQSDKGGGMPPAIPHRAGASGENEVRNRLYVVRETHTKRDQSDHRGRGDQDRDERNPYDEEEQYTV